MANNIIFGFIGAGLIGSYLYIANLQKKNENLENELNRAVSANLTLSHELNATKEQMISDLNAQKAMNERKKETVKYITVYKERLIKDENITCIDSVNDIFKRLSQSKSFNLK